MSKTLVNKLHTLTGHNHSIYALAEGSDPRFIYTGAGDGMVVEWDLRVPKDGRVLAKLPNSVYALAVDKTRNWLFVGHNFEGIHVIDLQSRKELWSLRITDQSIFDIQVYGDQVYIGTGGGVIVVMDMQERAVVKHLKVSDASIRVFSLLQGRNQLAVGSSDHTIKIFHLPEWEPVTLLSGHTNSVFALSYSPDGRFLLSGGRDATLKVWEVDTYEERNSIVAHMYALNFLSFREDGKYFVTCSMDKTLKIWDASSFTLLKVIDKARHSGHGTSINKVLWSSYAQQIIAISDDRTISVWDIQF